LVGGRRPSFKIYNNNLKHLLFSNTRNDNSY
jgi:hypothetical protein